MIIPSTISMAGNLNGNVSPLIETYPSAEGPFVPSQPYPPGLGFSGGGGGGGAEEEGAYGVRFTNGYRPGNENANLSKPLPSGGAYTHRFYTDPIKLGYSQLSPAEFTELTTPLKPYKRKKWKKTPIEAIQLERFFKLVEHQQKVFNEGGDLTNPRLPYLMNENIAFLRAHEQHEQAMLNLNGNAPNHATYGYMEGFPGRQERTLELWPGTPFTPRGSLPAGGGGAEAAGGGGTTRKRKNKRSRKQRSRKH